MANASSSVSGSSADTSALARFFRFAERGTNLRTEVLGGLTTFSTFSAESVQLLQAARYGAAIVHSAAHLLGAIVATALGFATWRALA